MAGLNCECGEATVVLPVAMTVEDSTGRLFYRRYRVCVDPTCDFYLVRRESYEFMAPLSEVKLYSHNNKQLSKYSLSPRYDIPSIEHLNKLSEGFNSYKETA